MALEYFLYNTGYSNTLIARSDSSFAPLPPDTGEINIDYFIPEIQPLYLYRESGGTIVYNNETIIDNYIQSTIPEPQANDSVYQYEFTGYTETTAPSTYYNKTEINTYTGVTDARLNQVVGENPLYAFSKTQGNGTQDSGIGLSVTRVSAGIYDYLFDTAVADNNYGIFAQPYGTLTNTNSQISNVSVFGFRVEMGRGDNGGTPDVLVDADHAVSVYGIPVSGATEIPVVAASTFIAYSADTLAALNLKAPLASPALTGVPTTPTAAVNTNTTQIASTAFVINQASAANPLMNGTVAIGTSLRYARQDHVHPTDTSRFAVAGGTITGSVAITGDLGVSGTTTLSATTIGSGLAKYDADYSATYDDRTLVDKEFVDTHPLVVLNTTSAGATTTTSTTDVLMTGMQITNVPAGTYLLNFGTSLRHGSNNSEIYTNIYVGGTLLANSEMFWRRGNANISNTHNYANFQITLAATATVDIRWRTDSGTATSVGNRYLTLLKTNSLV